MVWALWVAGMPEDASFIMVAKTISSLRRNVIELLEQLVGEKQFKYSLSKKEGRLFGRLVYFEGVSDCRAESKIRGMSLSGAYCDEITLFNEDFFTMLLSRLSKPGAKLIGTTNPDNPNHWFKKKYLDRKDELDLLDMKFLIDDNPFLSRDYVENLKKEYTGVFYDRFILGLWKAAEGIIYREFAEDTKKFFADGNEEIMLAAIGVDFGGNKSAHAFVCTGFTKGFREVIVLEEFYMKKAVSPEELEKCFVNFVRMCKEKYPVYDVYCDSAETTLIAGFEVAAARAGLAVDVRKAKKSKVTQRIRFFNMIMSQERFKIRRELVHLIDAISGALWDDKGSCDIRLDDGTVNVDSLDAMEYSVENYMEDILNQI